MNFKFKDLANLYLPFLAVCDDKSYMVHGYSQTEEMFQIDIDEQTTDWWSCSNFKPVLRSISDMTDDHKKELWHIVFGKAFHSSGRIIFINKKTTSEYPRWVMMSGVDRLGIELNGTVWADCDLSHYKHNQHEVTRWFLIKGFDLFGLLENNQAIDVKKLTKQS